MKTRLLFELKNPSEIAKKYIDDFSYAFTPLCKPSKIDEGVPALVYYSKSDLDNNNATFTFLDSVEVDNLFEYSVSFLK